MVKFEILPPSPFYSKIEFPDYSGLFETTLEFGWQPINKPPNIEFRVHIDYLFIGKSGKVRHTFMQAETWFKITKSPPAQITWQMLLSATNEATDLLKSFLSQTNLDPAYKKIPKFDLRQDKNNFEQMAAILNS